MQSRDTVRACMARFFGARHLRQARPRFAGRFAVGVRFVYMLLARVARDPGFGVTSAPFDLDALPRVAGTAGESRVRQAYSANARYGAYDRHSPGCWVQ